MTERLRVLHVLGVLNPSGAEVMLRSAGPLFSAAGLDSAILATGASAGVYAPRLAEAGYAIHHLPFARSPAYFWRVLRFFQTHPADVIHLHTERANFYFGLLAWLSGRRALRTIHAAFAFDGNLRWRRGLQRRLLHRLGLVHVAISPSVRQTERARFGLDTRLLPNWYDCAHFQPPNREQRQAARAELALADDEFVIASVGNCGAVKNHAALLEAMALLPAEQQPTYLHVGIEETEHPERQLASCLGLAERVRFLGRREDVRAILHAADGFVMPSLHEGFGVSAVEALACGLPALFTDVAGLRDFGESVAGLIYRGTSPSELADGLRALRAQAASWTPELARERQQSARLHYGMERGVAGYLALYGQPGKVTQENPPVPRHQP